MCLGGYNSILAIEITWVLKARKGKVRSRFHSVIDTTQSYELCNEGANPSGSTYSSVR